MKVERGGKAIVAVFVGAWFLVWAIAILAEVSFIAFVVWVPLFLILLFAWVLQIPGSAKAVLATIIGSMFMVLAIVVVARVSIIAFLVVVPLVIALLVAWIIQKPKVENTESEVPTDSITD